jgi:hypothetical protein
MHIGKFASCLKCHGIPIEDAQCSTAKKLITNTYPFLRFNSRDCPIVMPHTNGENKSNDRCLKCRLLKTQIKRDMEKKMVFKKPPNSGRKANSNIKISFLSPQSRKKNGKYKTRKTDIENKSRHPGSNG